jgi:hypothetical protein
VLQVRAPSREALVARAAAQCERLTARPDCERVLVVYRTRDARLYVENAAGSDKPGKDSRSS